MGQSNSLESKYSIDLQIDRNSYEIQDTLIGHVEYQVTQSETKYDLELRLQFIAEYSHQAWENVGGRNTFIWIDEIIKNCSKEDSKIYEKASFQSQLDLISTTVNKEGWFFVKYYVSACIRHRIGPHVIYLLNKDINFQVHRPYISIQRPICKESSYQIKSFICCNYGEIQVKVSLDHKDYLMNDDVQVKIDCDQTLSTRSIYSYQINFLSKTIYRDSRNSIQTQHILNTINFQGQQSKKYSIIQNIPLICQLDEIVSFHPSLECPNFTHTHYIQIIGHTGIFTDEIILEIPIIVYFTQEQQLKLYFKTNQMVRNQFNSDSYQQYKSERFLELKIKQENWKEMMIDFPQIEEQHKEKQESQLQNKLIVIQPSQS